MRGRAGCVGTGEGERTARWAGLAGRCDYVDCLLGLALLGEVTRRKRIESQSSFAPCQLPLPSPIRSGHPDRTGLDDLASVWQMQEWRNVTAVSSWAPQHLERVRGSDGAQFRWEGDEAWTGLACLFVWQHACKAPPVSPRHCHTSLGTRQRHTAPARLASSLCPAGRAWRWGTAWSCGWMQCTAQYRWWQRRR